MTYRIGIDVGGTFTDAVLMDNQSYEIVALAKVPTTHQAPEGVSRGIIEALHQLIESCSVDPSEVVFIAHGTTQATNALLEGDVVDVGIISLGRGLEGAKTRLDTQIEAIPLSREKQILSATEYLDLKTERALADQIREAIDQLRSRGAEAIVAAEAFSVDAPENEQLIQKLAMDQDLPATATSDISKLYGLKVRTRTAVVNASIMPKMLETAESTEKSIRQASIASPLMVMRCDGGVMTVQEMRSRPILTILSGPAAGVAGALMYEKLTDGLFFEVGGTSTDISCVKDGKVMLRYAQVGGHKTYLNSLDVRTVAIGGGSLIAGQQGTIVDVGPRSAHIAGMDYEVYTAPEKLQGAKLCTKRTGTHDQEYYYVENPAGEQFALTLAGAANLAGYVPDGDYAHGQIASAEIAWSLLAREMGITPREAAEMALHRAAEKNAAVVDELLRDYDLTAQNLVYVGGGGGASVVVPHLAKQRGVTHRISKNAAVISTIGVALAMVRDSVERTVNQPTEEDLRAIRQEVIQKAIENGAKAETIEVELEVDHQRHLLRATATGATELRSKDMLARELSDSELVTAVAAHLQVAPEEVIIRVATKSHLVCQAKIVEKRFLNLFKKERFPIRLIDREGVIRLQREDGQVLRTQRGAYAEGLKHLLDELTLYNDGGSQYPNLYILAGGRLINLSGLASPEQMQQMAELELAGLGPEEEICFLASARS